MDCSPASRIASVVTAWALALAGCHTVETTQAGAVGIDRGQTMTVFLKRQDAEHKAAREYARMVASAQQDGLVNREPQQVHRVRTVAGRLMAQTPAFREDAVNWQWEANVVTTAQVNAWCMLGGKIIVFSGLLDLGLTDDELAAVLGHEIAHSLREHLREVFGNSQQFEMEADLIGVELAARAGYDPRAAMTLWYKLSAVTTARPSGWLSTHPSNDVRLRELDQAISRVMPIYETGRTTSLQ
jgi:predicted Zn-dependent protease